MQKKISKGAQLYKNGLAEAQPEFADAKLKEDMKLISALDEQFSEVEGQAYACRAVKEQLFGRLRKPNIQGPAAIFVFAGPPAVGKTFLAQKTAAAMGCPFERFDMSGYSDKEAPISLFGLNKSYKSARSGRLTTFIKENPVAVILFDEIEKAHPNVLNNILQMLDKGAVRDLFYERDFSVRDCVLIFTTNVGTRAYETGNPYNLSATPDSTVINALQEEINPVTGERYFSRELVSRFASGKIIVFNRLRPEVLHRIAVRHLNEGVQYLDKEYGIVCRMDADSIADAIIFSQGGNADVRSVVRAVREFHQKNFERVAETVRSRGNGGRISVLRYKTDLSSATAEALEVLAGKGTARVLTFGCRLAGIAPEKCGCSIEEAAAGGDWDVHAILKCDPAMAVICVSRQNQTEAKQLFLNLLSAGIPPYIYTNESTLPLTFYEENGAVDCLVRSRGARAVCDWLGEAVRGISLGKAVKLLFRTNKVISFSTSYGYVARSCTAEVILSGFSAQIAYGGGEGVLFSGAAAIPDVTFDDIVGAEEAKREFAPVIRQLKNYALYKRRGIRIPRGIILDGPAGSGKTSVAKAVANAAGLPFIAMNATEFLSKWVGEGERKIREIFAAARRYAPSVIFIDEVDCIAKDRMNEGARSHTDGLTNALLSELDGFNSENSAPVFVIAATNFDTRGESKLDKAFLRRFDKKIHIGLPKAAERRQFISSRLAAYDFCAVSDCAVESIAKRSVGWSLADLNLVIQNAVRHSESGGKFLLTDGVLEEAFASFNEGERKFYDDAALRKTARHEAGHAVVAVLLGLKPAYTTIAARGGYGGYMLYSDEDKADFTRGEYLDLICVAMAGRAGEVCFYNEDGITTGAGGDIRAATDMAMRMVCAYGMEEDMILFADRGRAEQNVEVCARVQDIIIEQYGRALQLVRENADKVEAVADALVGRESLTDAELADIISSVQEA